MEVMKEPTAKF
jgi:uncharacterized membrane protein YfbV (UPF0208 family)